MNCYAVLPAAGRSRRMGTSKLLLPWHQHQTLIDWVLSRWRLSQVDRIAVVLHPDDRQLKAHVEGPKTDAVVAPLPPAEMKDSVLLGLQHLRQAYAPGNGDVWLLAPADTPGLTSDVVDRLVEQVVRHPGSILVPTFSGRRGHPVVFPWPMARQVETLTAEQGINVLLQNQPVVQIPVTSAGILQDVDTLADYDQLRPFDGS